MMYITCCFFFILFCFQHFSIQWQNKKKNWNHIYVSLVFYSQIKIANLKVLFSKIPVGLAVGIIVFYLIYLITLVLGNIQLSVWTSKTLKVQQHYYLNTSDLDQLGDADIVADLAHDQRIQLSIYFSFIAGQSKWMFINIDKCKCNWKTKCNAL